MIGVYMPEAIKALISAFKEIGGTKFEIGLTDGKTNKKYRVTIEEVKE